MSAFEEHSYISPSDADVEPVFGDDREAPRQRSVRASQRITALGEMTTGLAHDFRNVLAVIDSAVNLAERDPSDIATLDVALAAAREGIRRGTALTSKLLAFAKPSLHDAHAEDVNTLLEKLKLFLGYGAGPDIRVKLELAPGLPACRIDAPQFSAAILNLVVNARDAMPHGGEIRITSELSPLPETDDETARSSCILVRVIDQGHGMAKEVRDRIFDPYFTTKGETGTGLGVPQVASFMRAAGGCMNVSSEPGRGTSFELYFPICPSPALVGTDLGSGPDRRLTEAEHRPSPPPRFGH